MNILVIVIAVMYEAKSRQQMSALDRSALFAVGNNEDYGIQNMFAKVSNPELTLFIIHDTEVHPSKLC